MSDGDAGAKGRTIVFAVDPDRPEPGIIREAARRLAQGGLVVFPTETVYGLGADATNGHAVSRVFAAKGRPPDNPLIVHVASPEDVRPLVREVGDRAASLMRAFWPGPLSLVFYRTDVIAPEVSCGLDTVAIRMPAHPVALELIRLAGVPVAAPSANVSGRPSPTRPADVLADLDGLVDYVLDAGPCRVGLESTVLDLTGPVPIVLRPGGVTLEQLRRVVGEVRLLASGVEPETTEPPAGAARSPGLRHRHYSPRARLVLVPPGATTVQTMARVARAEGVAGRRVAVACADETAAALAKLLPETPARLLVAWGSRRRPDDIAARLFAVLRDLDQLGPDVILAEGLPPRGIGVAVNDRLRRAAASVLSAEPIPELILLVCSGNTCRSPMAAAILSDLLRRHELTGAFRVASAGTAAVVGEPASPEACQVMEERGLDLSLHRARQVSPALLAEARLVLTMTRDHRRALLDLHPGAADRTFTLRGYAGGGDPEDISDPYHRGLEVYRQAATEIDRAAERTVERLLHPPDLSGLVGGEAASREETVP